MTATGEELDVTVRSHRLHAQRYGSPSAPLVLAVHGLAGNMTSFDALGERLGGDALQLVALDLRGRGRSETTPPGTYGWANHALDLFGLADALGAERFGVIGQSMGGSVAMKAAEIDGSRLDAIVLLDVAGRVDPGVGPVIASVVDGLDTVHDSAGAYLAAVKAQGLVRPWSDRWDRVHRYQLVDVPGGGVRSRAVGAAVAEDRRYTATQDPYERWAHLTMPTLLLRATRELVPGAGHVVPAADRDRFLREVPRGVVVEVDANHLTIVTHPRTATATAAFLTALREPKTVASRSLRRPSAAEHQEQRTAQTETDQQPGPGRLGQREPAGRAKAGSPAADGAAGLRGVDLGGPCLPQLPAVTRVCPGRGLAARTSGVLTMLALSSPRQPFTPPAIEVEALVKTYGEVEAVRGVSFTVAPGEVFGFLGPNGAGKSTTINMLCTLARPTSGTARVNGFDIAGERDDVRRHIGLVFQDPTLDGYLTAEQNLRLHAELYGIDRGVIPERMRQMLEMVDLWDRRGQPVQTYSGGMRRRLEIARGLMHSPRVLFLDEPTIGLDPQTRSSIWRYIRALQETEGTTIFMTTHYMDEAELCDRIAIIDRGEIVVLDTPEALKASVAADRVVLGTTDDDDALAALRDRFDIEATMSEGAVTFHVASGEAFVPRLFAELGVGITSVAVSRPNLDDVFMRYTGSTIRDAETTPTSDRDRAIIRVLARSGR